MKTTSVTSVAKSYSGMQENESITAPILGSMDNVVSQLCPVLNASFDV